MSNWIRPPFSFEAISPPFSIHRNVERYQILSNNYPSTSCAPEPRAWTETQYYNKNLGESHIPSYLLYDFSLQNNIRQRELSMKNAIQYTNLMTSFCIDDNHFIIHVSGGNLEKLVVRPVEKLYSYDNTDMEGFTLKLGTNISQVEAAGTSNWSGNPLFLASSSMELFFLQSVHMSDYHFIANEKTRNKRNHAIFEENYHNDNTVILEPLQKWHVPGDSMRMTCMKSQYSISAIFAQNSGWYYWDPTSGLHLHQELSSLFPAIHSAHSSHYPYYTSEIAMEYSHHPMLVYTSITKDLYTIDQRSSSPAQSILSTLTPIRAISQHGKKSNILITSFDKMVSLFDNRFMKTSLLNIPLPRSNDGEGCSSILSFMSGEAIGTGNTDYLLSARGSSRQLLVHSLQLQLQQDNDCHENKLENGVAMASLLASSTNYDSPQDGMEPISFISKGFPVIDRRSLNNPSLIGALLVPYNTTHTTTATNQANNNNNDMSDEESVQGLQNQKTARQMIPPQHRALLIHQNSRGDVFAQKLCAMSRTTTTTTSTSSKSFVSENTDRDIDILASTTDHHPLTNTMSKKLQSVNSYQPLIIHSGVPLPPPPIQLCAPCGVVCHSVDSSNNTRSTTTSDNTSTGKRHRGREKLSRRGELLGNSLRLSDKVVNIYPQSEACSLPYSDESSLKRFDVIKLSPSNLNRNEIELKIKLRRMNSNENSSRATSSAALSSSSSAAPTITPTINITSLTMKELFNRALFIGSIPIFKILTSSSSSSSSRSTSSPPPSNSNSSTGNAASGVAHEREGRKSSDIGTTDIRMTLWELWHNVVVEGSSLSENASSLHWTELRQILLCEWSHILSEHWIGWPTDNNKSSTSTSSSGINDLKKESKEGGVSSSWWLSLPGVEGDGLRVQQHTTLMSPKDSSSNHSVDPSTRCNCHIDFHVNTYPNVAEGGGKEWKQCRNYGCLVPHLLLYKKISTDKSNSKRSIHNLKGKSASSSLHLKKEIQSYSNSNNKNKSDVTVDMISNLEAEWQQLQTNDLL